jgi:hypothetical protein
VAMMTDFTFVNVILKSCFELVQFYHKRLLLYDHVLNSSLAWLFFHPPSSFLIKCRRDGRVPRGAKSK